MTNEELILKEIREINQKVSGLDQKVTSLDQKVSDLEQEMRQGFAKVDQGFADIIGMIKVTQEQITRLDTKVGILNARSLEQETDIQLLKIAK